MNKWTDDIFERYGGDAGNRDHRRDHRNRHTHPQYKRRKHEEVRQECRLIASTSGSIIRQKNFGSKKQKPKKVADKPAHTSLREFKSTTEKVPNILNRFKARTRKLNRSVTVLSDVKQPPVPVAVDKQATESPKATSRRRHCPGFTSLVKPVKVPRTKIPLKK